MQTELKYIRQDFPNHFIHFLYDLYGHALAQEPLPGGHEIYNFGRPFLGHHYYKLSMSDLCLRVEKKTFEEILHFHNMTYKSTPQHKNPAPGSSKR